MVDSGGVSSDQQASRGGSEFYDKTYAGFADQLNETIRSEAFGEEIGQNSWLTADEQRSFCAWLELDAESEVLEVASGSGGPALFMARETGCRLTGVDVHDAGVAAANAAAAEKGLADRVRFVRGDAREPLPFDDAELRRAAVHRLDQPHVRACPGARRVAPRAAFGGPRALHRPDHPHRDDPARRDARAQRVDGRVRLHGSRHRRDAAQGSRLRGHPGRGRNAQHGGRSHGMAPGACSPPRPSSTDSKAPRPMQPSRSSSRWSNGSPASGGIPAGLPRTQALEPSDPPSAAAA